MDFDHRALGKREVIITRGTVSDPGMVEAKHCPAPLREESGEIDIQTMRAHVMHDPGVDENHSECRFVGMPVLRFGQHPDE
jgi:hypothetical protein